MLDSLSLYLANFENNKGGGMFLPVDFLLATVAIVIILICYVLLLVKLKKVDESSELSKLFEETYKDLSAQRRKELLEKIKEERIKEYLGRKKRKPRGS